MWCWGVRETGGSAAGDCRVGVRVQLKDEGLGTGFLELRALNTTLDFFFHFVMSFIMK